MWPPVVHYLRKGKSRTFHTCAIIISIFSCATLQKGDHASSRFQCPAYHLDDYRLYPGPVFAACLLGEFPRRHLLWVGYAPGRRMAVAPDLLSLREPFPPDGRRSDRVPHPDPDRLAGEHPGLDPPDQIGHCLEYN